MNQSFNSNPAQPPMSNTPPQMDQAALARAQFTQQAKNGARNFYWIAGLSFLNSIITAFGGEFYLVMGLASTLFVDYFAVGLAQEMPEMTILFKVIAVVVSLVISGVLGFLGFLAGKGRRWAYVSGLIFYAIDTVIMFALQEWRGLLIHLFFLWALFTGLRALNQLQKLEPAKQMDFPKNIGAP